MKYPFNSASIRIFVLAFALTVFTVPMLNAQRYGIEVIEGDTMYNHLGFDDIPSIDSPVHVSVSEADALMSPDEIVLGVIVNGEARAYSTWHLDSHEIVNDVIGGVPLAVTW